MGWAHKLQVRIHHLCHHVPVPGEEHPTLYRTHMPRVSILKAKERTRGELQKKAHFKSRRIAVHACLDRLPCSQERAQTVSGWAYKESKDASSEGRKRLRNRTRLLCFRPFINRT